MHHLRKATKFTDAAFISGFLAFKHQKLPQTQRLLDQAIERGSEIGQTLQRYQVQVFMSMPLTPELDVHIDADLRSALLGLAEIIMENEDAKQQQWQEIVRLGEGVENDRLSCRLTVV